MAATRSGPFYRSDLLTRQQDGLLYWLVCGTNLLLGLGIGQLGILDHRIPSALGSGMANTWTGGCLCGGVRYRLLEAPFGLVDCHCLDCRRASGAPYVTWGVVQRENFELLSGTLRAVPHAGRIRSFAACCGTQILFEDAPQWPRLDVTIATLDDPTPFPPGRAIWIEDKLSWVQLDPSIPTGAPTTPTVEPKSPPAIHTPQSARGLAQSKETSRSPPLG